MSNALVNAHTRAMKKIHEVFDDPERGNAIEYVIIAICVIGLAIALAAALNSKFQEKLAELTGL